MPSIWHSTSLSSIFVDNLHKLAMGLPWKGQSLLHWYFMGILMKVFYFLLCFGYILNDNPFIYFKKYLLTVVYECIFMKCTQACRTTNAAWLAHQFSRKIMYGENINNPAWVKCWRKTAADGDNPTKINFWSKNDVKDLNNSWFTIKRTEAKRANKIDTLP